MSAEHPNDEPLDPGERQRIWNEAQEHSRRHALIEQTKGILMFVYGIDADEAFELLRSQSQKNNIKLSLIAEQILKDMVELARTKGPARRRAFDGLMLTAHQRIADVAARQLDGQRKTGIPMKDI